MSGLIPTLSCHGKQRVGSALQLNQSTEGLALASFLFLFHWSCYLLNILESKLSRNPLVLIKSTKISKLTSSASTGL